MVKKVFKVCEQNSLLVSFMGKVDYHRIIVPVVEEAIGLASLLIPEPKLEEIHVLSDVEVSEVNTERIKLIRKLLDEVKKDTSCPSCITHVQKAEEEVEWLEKTVPSYERVAKLREGLKQLLEEAKELPTLTAPETVSIEKAPSPQSDVSKGVACIPCASDHFSTVAGLISDEAVRMARRSGVQDEEVVRRILRASDQLNAMEREDLSVEKIAGLPPWEKELAVLAQKEGAKIRHKLNEVKSVADLEAVATEVLAAREKIGSEYFKRKLERGEQK